MISQAVADSKLKDLGIEALGHDFMTPQPEGSKGAKVFYMRNVLHDWPDSKCTQMLSLLRDATADDSVVIIDESVVLEVGVDTKTVNYDITMMALMS